MIDSNGLLMNICFGSLIESPLVRVTASGQKTQEQCQRPRLMIFRVTHPDPIGLERATGPNMGLEWSSVINLPEQRRMTGREHGPRSRHTYRRRRLTVKDSAVVPASKGSASPIMDEAVHFGIC